MKVIVFGGSGFLGSHVADALTESGHTVTIFDLHPSPHLRPGQGMVIGRIQETSDVAKAVSGADVVYNFAGISDIQEAHLNPLETVRTNILGNCIILDACIHAKVKRYMFASTLYVYSQTGSFYSVSKQACESYIENYHRYYGQEYTILRYGSLYGSRAPDTNTVQRMLHEALTTGKMTYYGTGEETREYIHVDDAARYSVEALKLEFANQNLILTGHQSMKVHELMEMINEMLGCHIQLEFKPAAPGNSTVNTHYNLTPYSYTPRLGRKIIGRQYIDLGQGLLRCMEELHVQTEQKRRR